MRRSASATLLVLSLSFAWPGIVVAPSASAAVATVASTGSGSSTGFEPGDGTSLDTDAGLSSAPSAARLDRIREESKASQQQRPRSRALTAPQAPTAGTYELGPDEPQRVPRSQMPYTRNHPVALDGNQPRDATGVAVYLVEGREFQHPVRQALDGIDMLESYKLTGNATYLARSQADAKRLIETRRVSREAWFFPYEFDFALHGDPNDVIAAPWYSAMAQGTALSLFTQLYEQTRDPGYEEAARRTMASLLLGPSGDLPFVTWVDSSKHLFLEEYAQQPLDRSDRTLNGHVFAVYGLYEYYLMTEDPAAKEVFSGALKLVRDYYANYRNVGWISSYCLTHPEVHSGKYHAIHVQQLRVLQGLTGRTEWSDWSDELFADYPDPEVRTTLQLAAGRQVGYKFDARGAIIATRVEPYSRVTAVAIDRRERIKGRGVFYRVTSGPWAGWFLPEQSGRSYARAMLRVRQHPLARSAELPAREILVRQFDNAGNTTSLRRISLSAPTAVRYRYVTVINGETWIRPVDGPAPDYWVRAADVGVGVSPYTAPVVRSVAASPAQLTRASIQESLPFVAGRAG
ncbi:hypothetical protein N864_06370 [Intrasporangium chromatireducens Q5-1]|uniref:D-glucuronyl C5-epimerase C-terminal domain-containing protein n=1 Tax=Intrasporangium chromatireducens Q5-1 TaxID=584657 RepID=W9GN84_9MICO|nr:D-glucuronyl C5-epimerase family protein [Intrasporangium chromatireducens]EWT07565.1 hypothetical protein N864_06370 [Intrasporangium chromatireducens Q5-1]